MIAEAPTECGDESSCATVSTETASVDSARRGIRYLSGWVVIESPFGRDSLGRWTSLPQDSHDEHKWAYVSVCCGTHDSSHDVSLDGHTLFAVHRAELPIDDQVHVVANWLDELSRLVPVE